MDFHLTIEQRDIQKAASEFAKGEFDPDAALDYDLRQQFPLTVWKNACELGFVGVHFPEEHGGQELGLLENVLIVEAFCRQDSGIGMALALSGFGSEMIVRNGNEDQKKRILPFIAHGEGIVTSAFLEEGYSLAPLATAAKISKGGCIVNGMKSFVTLGSMADYIIVVCQTRPDTPNAQVVILLERKIDGIEVSSMGEKVGMRMIPVDQVAFTNVRVPAENIIGQAGTGYFQLQNFLNEMRIKAGAMGIGIAQGGLDKALEYSRKREQFGKPIASFGAVRNKLADMYIDVEMARLITYKAAWSFDTGAPDDRVILMSKMIASKAAYRNAYEAVQIYGGYGYMTEGQIEHFYRDAKVLDLFLEPGQIQRNILADHITGKARDR
ncbi:MAG TPA: acyl-CoA dehydrogenase [Desulfobacteraceae bacterium]|nr:acyl-CoA dehydrogenase [Desulfobacteraceae bacterium]